MLYPFLIKNESDTKKAGKVFLKEDVDMVLTYHATYIDEMMSVAMISEIMNFSCSLSLVGSFGSS